MEVAGTREVRLWVMAWGAQAVVLEPESLKKDIRAEIKAMQKQYKNLES